MQSKDRLGHGQSGLGKFTGAFGNDIFLLNQPVQFINHNVCVSLCLSLPDMENVMSVVSAARVKILSLGKILALNIRYYVKNALSVTILHIFFCKIVLVKEKLIVKNGLKGLEMV